MIVPACDAEEAEKGKRKSLLDKQLPGRRRDTGYIYMEEYILTYERPNVLLSCPSEGHESSSFHVPPRDMKVVRLNATEVLDSTISSHIKDYSAQLGECRDNTEDG